MSNPEKVERPFNWPDPPDPLVQEASDRFVARVMTELGEVSNMTLPEMKKKILFLRYQARGEALKSKAETYTRNSGQALFHKKNAQLFAKHHNSLVSLYKRITGQKTRPVNMARKQILGM